MRLAVVLACCAACGRVGFDSQPSLGSGNADAGHDASADGPPDGAKHVYLLSGGATSSDPTDLLTLDIDTGHVTAIGQLSATLGQLGGLAYWDANTLYATGGGNIVKITLDPFAANVVAAGAYTMSALERDGSDLIGLEQGTNVLVRFQPPYMNPVTLGTGLTVDGGDIVQTTTGTWFYYSNTTAMLYTFDPVTGTANAVGPSSSGGFVSALLRDATDHLYITVEGTNALIPISSVDGTLGTPLTLCESCPTTYSLGAGDATRTP